MTKIQMKPETIARREVERAKARSERRASLMARLQAKAVSDPDGIWGELLTEQEA